MINLGRGYDKPGMGGLGIRHGKPGIGGLGMRLYDKLGIGGRGMRLSNLGLPQEAIMINLGLVIWE